MTTDEARDAIANTRPCRETMEPLVYGRALRAADRGEPGRIPIWG